MATPTDPRRARRPLGLGLLLVLAAGCGQPQVAPEHRELVLKLATGASTRDPAIIDRAAAEVDDLAASSELGDDEEAAFRAIIAAARDGDWERAEQRAYALRDGQEPTEEDRRRVEQRTLRPVKKVGKKRGGTH